MYGGDEVSTIVVDLGLHTCKAGYPGEYAPKAVSPYVIGSLAQIEVHENDNDNPDKRKSKLYVGSTALGYHRDDMEVLPSIKDGILTDGEFMETIWDHAFRECLLVDPKDHPMLLVEPSSNTQQQREKLRGCPILLIRLKKKERNLKVM